MPGWSSGVQLLATPRGRPSFVSKTNSRRRRRKLSAAKLQRSRENIARHSRSIGRDSSQQCIVENEDPRSFIYLSIANFEKPESSCYTWIVNFKILENSKNRFFLVQANPKMIWLRPKSRDGKVSLAVHWRANFENSLRIMLLNRSRSPPSREKRGSIDRSNGSHIRNLSKFNSRHSSYNRSTNCGNWQCWPQVWISSCSNRRTHRIIEVGGCLPFDTSLSITRGCCNFPH